MLTENVLDKGFVVLLDTMPYTDLNNIVIETIDSAITEAARISYGKSKKKTKEEDEKLIRYLMRNRHTSPFEMVEFKFHCKMPIFIARQWIRHRTASVNEISGRYSEMKDDWYIPDPDNVKGKSKTNKQGSEAELEEGIRWAFVDHCTDTNKIAFEDYQEFLEDGVSNEMARINLPLSTYTEWIWKIDLHNLLHFLALRMDHHAQYEIRCYAEAIYKLISPIVPLTIKAWDDYHPKRNAITLSQEEIEVIRDYANQSNAAIIPEPILELGQEITNEQKESIAKFKKLGLMK